MASATPATGLRAEFLEEIAYYEQRYMRLAEAMPAEKYTGRPFEGVRAVSEVFTHITAANYDIAGALGTAPPAGIDLKAITGLSGDKPKVLQAMKDSFAHFRNALAALNEAGEDQPQKMFNRQTTLRGSFIMITGHFGEHFGQSIAYARMNGIVPSWTEESRQQQQKAYRKIEAVGPGGSSDPPVILSHPQVHSGVPAVYNNYVPLRIKSEWTLAALAPVCLMLKRAFISVALLSLALAADAAAQSVVPDSRPAIGPARPDFFNRVIANQKKGEAALDLYERIERVETRKNPSDPAPPAIKILRVVPSGTGMFRIPVGDDGKPKNSAAYRADLESLARALALLVSDAASQRDALEKYAKKKKDRSDLIDATHNAFLFTFVAYEPRGDRTLSKYKMEPNPAFKPTSRFSAIFPKVRGFVWVDEASGELARVEGNVTEDLSVGLFLGKIYKGSHFMQERYEFLPGLWLASFSQYDFDGRKLFSSFSVHERTFYSNYRYIGPPKEALAAIRQELGLAESDKPHADAADQ